MIRSAGLFDGRRLNRKVDADWVEYWCPSRARTTAGQIGVRVRSKIVPAVTDVRREQVIHPRQQPDAR